MAQRTVHTDMPYRVLGRTREQVSALGLGGWHLGFKRVDEHLSLRIVRSAIDRGINFMDNCWDYNDGTSEIRMGNAAARGEFELFKITSIFDGTAQHPQWLGEEPPRLQHVMPS
jgi:aryl-alcohol dehydrogenase-like predicted oxidoreductase